MKTPKINIGKLLNQINSFGEDAQRLAVAVTNSTADEIVASAKQKAPVDLGQLRQSIGKTNATVKENRSFIFANTPYAAFVEFGTGGKVSIPKGFEPIAVKFKGRGIRQVNIRPQPYLIPSYIQGVSNYTKKLVAVLQRNVKLYNNKK